MADPEDLDDKPVDEVLEMLEVEGEGGGGDSGAQQAQQPAQEAEPAAEAPADAETATADAGGTAGAAGGGDDEWSEAAARQFLSRMVENDNRAIPNDYGEPILELLVLRSSQDEVEALIEEWDINPSGPDSNPQSPSFADDRPEVSEGMTGFQFILKDEDNTLDSSGYEISAIIEGLMESDEPFLLTLAPRIQQDALDQLPFDG